MSSLMRYTIIFVVVAALASSISALPATDEVAGADSCSKACLFNSQCSSKSCMAVHSFLLHSESYLRFYIGGVWPLTLTRELLVICRSRSRKDEIQGMLDCAKNTIKGPSTSAQPHTDGVEPRIENKI
ncbi:hypothetical protein EV424DRAFT_1386613 [Suillus variegatus]|nr:hypothetical protein EV424DRAFT_1386613 [Suillus variegatus]